MTPDVKMDINDKKQEADIRRQVGYLSVYVLYVCFTRILSGHTFEIKSSLIQFKRLLDL